MSIERRLICLAMGTAALAAAARAEDAPATPPQPKKLTAFAYVTVRATKLASEAARLAVAAACRRAVPKERFESLTVSTDKSLEEAQREAAAAKAQLFLHITAYPPKGITYKRRVPVTSGGWRGRVTIEEPYYTLRCPVMVEMSIQRGPSWRTVKTVKMTSAEAAGAESEFLKDRKDLSRSWPNTAGVTARAAVERALVEHFLPNVKLRAISAKPAEASDGGGEQDKPDPEMAVRFELTNRSHCRIVDATVTVELYDSEHKRWDPVGVPQRAVRVTRGPAGEIRRVYRLGGGPRSSVLSWAIPAIVDSGQQAFSEEVPVPESAFRAMNSKKCRIVLHATPATTDLTPPTYLAPLKTTVKPKA